jgi:hypothetical protein
LTWQHCADDLNITLYNHKKTIIEFTLSAEDITFLNDIALAARKK